MRESRMRLPIDLASSTVVLQPSNSDGLSNAAESRDSAVTCSYGTTPSTRNESRTRASPQPRERVAPAGVLGAGHQLVEVAGVAAVERHARGHNPHLRALRAQP